ncbi:hypothetical protein K4K60_010028 [Colletotrichum sp. SAR11_57]|nr:hypothetical protein K4K60_010028 [Colletotrichum sp. SAR11_57]
MSDDWLISVPFDYVNEEEAEWRFHDRPGQTHREDLVGWEATNRSGVKGRLVEVVHGYKAGSKKTPRTLVVFEWRLLPGPAADRIKEVEIIVAFRAIGRREGIKPGDSIADFDPVPIQWAPNEMIPSHFCQAQITEAVNVEYGVQAGHEPYIGLTGKRNTSSSQVVERIDYRYITGSPTYIDKSSGTRNAMKWELSENAQLKSGVQHEVRTAVLLRRQAYDFEKFNVAVIAQANDTGVRRMLRTMQRMLRIPSADGPASFDPKVLPGSSDGEVGEDNVAARKTTRDWQNLDNLDLEDVLLKDWGVGSVEDLVKKAAQAPPANATEAQ